MHDRAYILKKMHIVPSPAAVIGCDIGGTSCKLGVITPTGRVLDHIAFPVRSSASLETFRANLFDTLDQMAARQPVRGIGALLPGYLRENRTIPHIMVNLRMLEGVPLARWLSDRYGVAVSLDIDRNGPALAESLFHYRHQVSRLLYVTIGTGLGVGLVTNGVICRICHDSIGELGHITLDPGGARCACGNEGCAETLLSRDGIGRIAQRLGLCASLRQNETSREFPEALYREAASGHPEARRVFVEFGRYLGAALVTFSNTFSPDIIVIGGGLSGASEFFLPTAERYLNEHWIERVTKRIPVRRTNFGAHAGVIGAASLVLP